MFEGRNGGSYETMFTEKSAPRKGQPQVVRANQRGRSASIVLDGVGQLAGCNNNRLGPGLNDGLLKFKKIILQYFLTITKSFKRRTIYTTISKL